MQCCLLLLDVNCWRWGHADHAAHAGDTPALCCRYKAAKAELAEIESELLVLERTLTVLAQQEAATLAQLGAVEREIGVTGYAETWVSNRVGCTGPHSSGCLLNTPRRQCPQSEPHPVSLPAGGVGGCVCGGCSYQSGQGCHPGAN